MRIPAPINSPLRFGDLESRITSPAWFEWFQRLSDYYEAIAKYLDPDNVLFGKIEPSNAQDGLLAYANGTDWNPGSGAGYYRRNGPVWEFASAISATDYATLAAFNDHSARHQNGGADEMSVAGMSGLLADSQNPLSHDTSHENGGSDEISIAGLSGLAADAQTPLAHDTSHENGGADEISIAGLSGEAADQQPPKSHDNTAHSTAYQATSEKDSASGYAGLNSVSRGTKGIDTTDDLIVDLETRGLVLKDTQGTPHYWRGTISTLGVLTFADLGTTKP